MKIFKNLIYTMITAMVLFAVNACTDDFSDEDFFNAQKDAAAAADAQLQADITTLASFNFIVVESGKPASGLDVNLIPLDVVAGTPSPALSGTTDANGVAPFTDVPTGSSLIIVSGANIVTTNVLIRFDDNLVTNNGSRTIVLKRNESAAIEVFSTDFSESTQTATIKGNVTAEFDLTNTTPEIPSNLVISANFSKNLIKSHPNRGQIKSVTLAGKGDFGSSAVDSVGGYSMIVPVINKDNPWDNVPYTVELLIPSFTADQMVAFTVKDGVDVGPTRENILTGFGGSYGINNNTPRVPGLLATFPAPPVTTGAGFAVSLSQIATRLGDWNGVGTFKTFATPGDTTLVSYDVSLDSRGSGYQRSPDVTLSGGGPTAANQAKMYASLRGLFTAVKTTSTAGDYTATETVDIDMFAWAVSKWDDTDTVQLYVSTITGVTVATDGTLPATVSLGLGAGAGFDFIFQTGNINSTYGYRIMRFEGGDPYNFTTPPVTPAKVTVEAFDSQVDNLTMVDNGGGVALRPSYYTSAPVITFSGGLSPIAATVQATASLSNFRNYYMVDVDNSGVTEPYNAMPDIIQIRYEDGYTFNDGFSAIGSNSLLTDEDIYWGPAGDLGTIHDNNNDVILDRLMIDGSGNLQWQDASMGHMTYYMGGPNTAIDVTAPLPSEIAEADFDNGAGGGPYIDPDTGEVLAMRFIWGGSAYPNNFDVAIALSFSDLPGSGASVQINNISGGSWGGTYTVLTPGSGYLVNVNQVMNLPSSGPPNTRSIYVQPGGTYVSDIEYGAGERFVDVEGFEY